jgi:hypothetical protein
MKNLLILLMFTSLIVACKKEEDLCEGFTPFSETTVFDSLQLSSSYTYYEIRDNSCGDSSIYFIIASKGNKPYTDSIFSGKENGTHYSCVSFCMCCNILTYDGSDYHFISDYEDILDFLGPIGCKGNALFVAHLNGYYFRYNEKEFGLKEVSDGFLIYACKLVSMCTPVQTDKFLIHVDHLGNIKVLKETVLSKDDQACI